MADSIPTSFGEPNLAISTMLSVTSNVYNESDTPLLQPKKA